MSRLSGWQRQAALMQMCVAHREAKANRKIARRLCEFARIARAAKLESLPAIVASIRRHRSQAVAYSREVDALIREVVS